MLLNLTRWALFAPRENCPDNFCPFLTALWIIHSVFAATLFVSFIELPLTDLTVRSNAWYASVSAKHTDETMGLQQKIVRFKIYFETCQTYQHFNAEEGRELQEPS